MNNPYADALYGLDLPDPVTAFFDFCREREAIRARREAGQPAPWTRDPVLQRGRFLNVFREDDRGTRALLRWLRPVADDLPTLVQAAFFGRWCNQQSTLDRLNPELLSTPDVLLATLQNGPQPWSNVTAYPVEPARFERRLVPRLRTATHLFHDLRHRLVDVIRQAEGDIVQATGGVNALLNLDNDFPIFMAVTDLAWFRPDLVDPASPVPTGIGALPFLDRLERHLGLHSHEATCARIIALQPTLWPEAKRPLQPIDVEYLSCECRKYYSYVNGTKAFEGKNCFVPGQDPRLLIDVAHAPTEEVQTRVVVLAGGPCSGKTSLLKALEQAGHRVVPETSRVVLEAGLEQGLSPEQMRADPVAWQERMMRADVRLLQELPTDERVFLDTSAIEDLVYAERAGLAVGPNIQSTLRHLRFDAVFFLEPVPWEEDVRLESPALALALGQEVFDRYTAWGYAPIRLPLEPVEERLRTLVAGLPG